MNATGPENVNSISIQNLTAIVNKELSTGKIPTNGTYLVIYANGELGPIGWSGSILSNGNSATQEGTGRAVIPIDCGSTMLFQKQSEGGYLGLVFVDHGKIDNKELTNAAYGVVTMSAGCIGNLTMSNGGS